MLSIIIPAYNEEKRLPEVLDRTLKYLKNRKIKNEIIIVADKSKDRTLDVVQEYTKKFKIELNYFFYEKVLMFRYDLKNNERQNKNANYCIYGNNCNGHHTFR